MDCVNNHDPGGQGWRQAFDRRAAIHVAFGVPRLAFNRDRNRMRGNQKLSQTDPGLMSRVGEGIKRKNYLSATRTSFETGELATCAWPIAFFSSLVAKNV